MDAAVSTSDAQKTAEGTRRVLVVDDNVDAADTLAHLLRLEGFDVRKAYDGTSGLALAREFLPEVAFVDLNMPGMSGLELGAALRAEQQLALLRIVALTGMGQKTDLDATRAAGFDAHLTKPASVEDVRREAAAVR
jgi:CheY-like chemotaxis protein